MGACYQRQQNNILAYVVLLCSAGRGNRFQVTKPFASKSLSTCYPDSATAPEDRFRLRGLRLSIPPPHYKNSKHQMLTHLVFCFCAGRGNRTPVSTLGRSHSTTKPYPQCYSHQASALSINDSTVELPHHFNLGKVATRALQISTLTA